MTTTHPPTLVPAPWLQHMHSLTDAGTHPLTPTHPRTYGHAFVYTHTLTHTHLHILKHPLIHTPVPSRACPRVVNHCQAYAWGSGADGQLGLGEDKVALLPTRIICLPKRTSFITCSQFHAAALTPRGHVYTWGRGAGGALARPLGTVRGVPCGVVCRVWCAMRVSMVCVLRTWCVLR
jgi:hypothetical protein